jgi:hypothetical protein
MQIETKEHVAYSYSLTGLNETHLELLAGLLQHVVLGEGDKYREAAYDFLSQLEGVIDVDNIDSQILVSCDHDEEYGTPVFEVTDVSLELDSAEEWPFYGLSDDEI